MKPKTKSSLRLAISSAVYNKPSRRCESHASVRTRSAKLFASIPGDTNSRLLCCRRYCNHKPRWRMRTININKHCCLSGPLKLSLRKHWERISDWKRRKFSCPTCFSLSFRPKKTSARVSDKLKVGQAFFSKTLERAVECRIARIDEEGNIQNVGSGCNSLPPGPAGGLPLQAGRKTRNAGESRGRRAVYRQQRSAVFGDYYPAHTGGTGFQGGRLR